MKKTLKISLALCFLCGLITLTGCASFEPKEDGSFYSWGLFRNMKIKRTYHPDGSVASEEIITTSTTKDILLGANEFIDTAVETGSKLKP